METNLGLSFSLDRITDHKEYLCTNLEVWFVLEGSVRVSLNQTDFNLAALAEEMYVSTSTLSRLFHKYAGVYFADYVNQVRLRHACEELVFTQKNLTRIAVDNGFSSSSAFNRVFKKVYDMTPSEYRQQKTVKNTEEKAKKEQKQEALLQEVLEKKLLQTDEADRHELMLSGDAEGKKWEKNWNIAINIGTMYDLTLANIQNHVLYLQEHLSYRYIRIWNVLSKRMMISDGQTKGSYNFMMVDQVLDFLMKNRLRPFLDLGRLSGETDPTSG